VSSNAVTHFDAFYMARILEEPDQFAAQSRQARCLRAGRAIR
jgi:hypothetical protein